MTPVPTPDRRTALAALALTGVGAALAPAAAAATDAAAPAARPSTPQAALRRIVAGNARFAAGRARHRGQGPGAVRATAAAQHPYVIVLGCSDSRVPPEIVLDEEIGAVFDLRVAGNVLDPTIIGSIEFAVAEFAPPLLLVLAHERCGAVSATVGVVRDGGEAPGYVQSLVEAIRPAVLAVQDRPGDLVDNAVRANAHLVAAQLVRRSGVVRRAVRSGALAVRSARYDLDTGRVRLLPDGR